MPPKVETSNSICVYQIAIRRASCWSMCSASNIGSLYFQHQHQTLGQTCQTKESIEQDWWFSGALLGYAIDPLHCPVQIMIYYYKWYCVKYNIKVCQSAL